MSGADAPWYGTARFRYKCDIYLAILMALGYVPRSSTTMASRLPRSTTLIKAQRPAPPVDELRSRRWRAFLASTYAAHISGEPIRVTRDDARLSSLLRDRTGRWTVQPADPNSRAAQRQIVPQLPRRARSWPSTPP
jgi:hypothetical protein